MPGLADILLASSLILGGHEMGHQVEADRLGVDINWKTRGGLPFYVIQDATDKEAARIFNSGFAMQDTIAKGADSNLMRYVSAANKLGYALFPKSITGQGGDVDNIGKLLGNKTKEFAQGVLITSALSDLFRKPNSKLALSYGQSNQGAPMLVLNGRF